MGQGFMQWREEPKIILGLDIGTTQSAVSYALLFKGSFASVKRIAKWPGQEKQQEGSRIPTQVYYDSRGRAMKCGAETMTTDTETQAEEHEWKLAKHFKLHVHPDTMKGRHNIKMDPLPPGTTLRQIYIDFLKHMLNHTRDYIRMYEPDGEHTWTKYSPTMDIVIAHPNGWSTKEQGFLREVAIASGFCNQSGASTQIKFVSEAEASVHFCLVYADLDRVLKPGVEFIVCDAGGSTVDTTAYGVVSTEPRLALSEKKVSACLQAGGVFVDEAARTYLSKILQRANLDEETLEEYVKKGVEEFEIDAKRQFSGTTEPISIKIGERKFTNAQIGVNRGKLKIPGEHIQGFFQGPVNDIVDSVKEQLSGLQAKRILLVGGFGESRYLRKRIVNHFGASGIQVNHADDGKSKAVADGAVIWLAKMSVSKRAVRFFYGISMSDIYDENKPAHRGRNVELHASGYSYIQGAWGQIVAKGQLMEVGVGVKRSFCYTYKIPNPTIAPFSFNLYAYGTEDQTASQTPPEMLMTPNSTPSAGFTKVCAVSADLSSMSGNLVSKSGSSGAFWQLDFDITLEFGGTELKALVEWQSKGQKCVGPATIIPSALD